MGGGDGTVITKKAVAKILVDPQVHGILPATTTGALDPVLWSDAPTNTVERDASTWSKHESEVVARATHWLLTR